MITADAMYVEKEMCLSTKALMSQVIKTFLHNFHLSSFFCLQISFSPTYVNLLQTSVHKLFILMFSICIFKHSFPSLTVTLANKFQTVNESNAYTVDREMSRTK